MSRTIHIGTLILENGHHVGGWRYPDAERHGGHDFDFYKRIVEIAERGKFDMVFFADYLGLRDTGDADARSRQHNVAYIDPVSLITALSVVTKNIGLVTSVSTTYNSPFNVARKIASIDHLSQGRAGWNLVTSATDAEARNFNLAQQVPHHERYQRASEFVDVVRKLWDTWDDDAFVLDAGTGRYYDPDKLHLIAHQGEHYQVLGPLNVARAPQGHPVVFQAGASDDGQWLAARTAEAVYTAAQTKEAAQAYYRSLKQKVVAVGRDPASLLILPGIVPFIGRSYEEALEKQSRIRDAIHPAIGVGLLSVMIGHDLRPYDVDGPLPDIPLTEGHRGRQQLLIDLARRESLTIRQLYQRSSAFGHRELVGTPESIADVLEDLFRDEAADGFNILPPYLPGGLEDFVDQVVPILQQRGLFRREYQGRTLRDHLGLARPHNRFTHPPRNLS
jgi:alkanesulfonate monooxygenase